MIDVDDIQCVLLCSVMQYILSCAMQLLNENVCNMKINIIKEKPFKY